MTKIDYISLFKQKKSYKITNEDIPNVDNPLIIGCLDLPITTMCTLKCKNCSSLMPYYQHPTLFSTEVILKQLDVLFSVVDKILRVNVLGGEPFLHKDLDKIIRKLSPDKVKKVLIITNGTVVPKNKELLLALRQKNVEVRISDYKSVSINMIFLLLLLEVNKIHYTIKSFGKDSFNWYDFGDFSNRGRTTEELNKQYLNCDVEWGSIIDGKLFPCPRSAHATDLGLISNDSSNYINIFKLSNDKSQLKKQLEDFIINDKAFNCCNYCDRGTSLCKKVKVAEQIVNINK